MIYRIFSAIVSAALIFLQAEICTAQCPANPVQQLPEDHPDQKVLIDYMKGLGQADFEIKYAPLAWVAADAADDEQLYRQWLSLFGSPPGAEYPGGHGIPAMLHSLHADPADFCLSKIQRQDGIYSFWNPESTAWWAEFNVPGNIYRGSGPNGRAVKLRTFVQSAVLMMMWDKQCSGGGEMRRGDFVGKAMTRVLDGYFASRDVLPAEVRAAFEAGLLRQLALMEKICPRGDGNMDMAALVALAYLSKIFSADPGIKSRCVRVARRILFGAEDGAPDKIVNRGKALFRNGGWVAETGGPEAAYNGFSMFWLVYAALISRGDPDWDAFLPEVISRMNYFKSIQHYPDPDGVWDGPSSYSGRTADSYVHDQSGSYFRDLGAAAIADSAIYLVASPRTSRYGSMKEPAKVVPDPEELREGILQAISLANRKSHVSTFAGGAYGEPAKDRPQTLRWGSSPSYHAYTWPETNSFLYEFYPVGLYGRLRRLQDEKSPLLNAPNSRPEPYSVSFDNEFWACKSGEEPRAYGWFVETIDENPSYYYGDRWKIGGSLCLFWTRPTGTVIMGKSRGHGNPPDLFSLVDNWATHHIWGKNAEGKPFSSARNADIVRDYSHLSDAEPKVSVTGKIGQHAEGLSAPEKSITGELCYEREFSAVPGGLAVSSRISYPKGDDKIRELWETLPIYLSQGRVKQEETRIEFIVNGSWQTASDQLVTSDSVRLTRFGASVLIKFTRPVLLRLAPNVWTTEYQTRNRIRNLDISFIEKPGEIQSPPEKAEISYSICVEPDQK